MVGSLLHSCGLSLGPEDELKHPAHDNPEGYFENRSFVLLNEELMSQFGGSWDNPPNFHEDWEATSKVSRLVERAENLIVKSRAACWGWKDPRNSLTLPFWQRLLPDLKVIVCVRNPLEVARSLFLRGDASEPSQFQLWLTYYRRLLASTSAEQRLVTHYQSYFQSAPAELRRVLDWLEVEVSDETLAEACAHTSAGLRHHYVTTADLFEARVPDEVLGLYLNLCAEAGPVYQQARNNETLDDQSRAFVHDNEVSELWTELQQVRAEAAAREQTLNEILDSRAFKLASWYWRRRGRK